MHRKRPCGFSGDEALRAFLTFLILLAPILFFALVFTLGNGR